MTSKNTKILTTLTWQVGNKEGRIGKQEQSENIKIPIVLARGEAEDAITVSEIYNYKTA